MNTTLQTLFITSWILAFTLSSCNFPSKSSQAATATQPPASETPNPQLLATPDVPTELGIDSGLFTGKPCKAPCWHNLIPGLSTGDDVNSFINTLSKDEWAGMYFRSYESGCKYIRISDKAGDYVNKAVEFHVENGKLTFIQSVPKNMPTLGDVVDHIGFPEYIEAILAVGPEESGYVLNVFYPKRGLAFNIDTNKGDMDNDKKNTGYIKRGMKVFLIQYFPPGDLLSSLTVAGSCYVGQEGAVENANNDIAKYVQLWPGFGEVKLISSK